LCVNKYRIQIRALFVFFLCRGVAKMKHRMKVIRKHRVRDAQAIGKELEGIHGKGLEVYMFVFVFVFVVV